MSILPSREFIKAYSAKNLAALYESKLKTSKAIGLDRVSPDKFAGLVDQEISTIVKKVWSGAYRFTPYRERLISKGFGKKPRVLSIPTVRDRLTLRALCDFLFKVFPVAKAQLPQIKVDAIRTAVESGAYSHFVKLDVEQFYPSIDHKFLLKEIGRRIRKKEAVNLILAAIRNPTVSERLGGKNADPAATGVPQGLSISNGLAEIYLQGIDRKALQNPGIKYFRYVDDILILCGSDYEEVAQALISQLKSLKLVAHQLDAKDTKSKHGKIDDGFDFLGYIIKKSGVSVRRSSVLNIEASIVRIFTAYRHATKRAKTQDEFLIARARLLWHLNLRITGCIYKGQRLGWVFYFSQLTDTGVLRGIDGTVTSLLKRFQVPTEVKPKTLLKTFYECSRADVETHKYIPNFDMSTLEDQKAILTSLGFPIADKTDAQIKSMFRYKIASAVAELEKDLQHLS